MWDCLLARVKEKTAQMMCGINWHVRMLHACKHAHLDRNNIICILLRLPFRIIATPASFLLLLYRHNSMPSIHRQQ